MTCLGKIIKLDEQLSNKIAAGEVVERPASIVKELVENAIDANSSEITIEIEEGGLSSIRIIDNGDGIEKEDVVTAFYRHATSKIKSDKDLFQIKTLGFRGEALPSIASVSFLELQTSTGEGPGSQINLEGGTIVQTKSTKSRKGTDITVTNLFYNTPARLKHLKTVHTELGNISDIVNRLALAHPNISFRLIHNGKDMLSTNGNGNQQEIIAAIYGRSIAQKMLSIEESSIDFRITGWVSLPEVTRASRQYISIFINGRFIRNYQLARAIQEGYHTLLPIGRYPIVVLNIEMDPLLIDVNVHPAKLEARISKEEALCELVKNTIVRRFRQTQLIPQIERLKIEREKSEQLPLDLSTFNHQSDTERVLTEKPKKCNEDMESLAPKVSLDNRERVTNTIVKEDVLEEKGMEKSSSKNEGILAEKTNESRVPVLYPIGQMHGTYILAQNEEGLYIIDQHAAQERIKYEYFKEKVGQVTKELQELLLPITLEYTHQEVAIIEEHKEKLKEVGVFLEAFGPQSYVIRSHPAWFPKGLEEETIKELINQLLTSKKVEIKKLREEAAILMSCKAAIKANRYLRQDELFSLLETLRKTSDPFTCPHGRPIIVHITTYEMEKMFKRVM